MGRQRIGELLLEKGLITQEQLALGLRDQEILGGHLGTCLIALGFVKEEALGRALGEQLKMRYASWAELAAASDEAIQSVPQELVQKHRVVPFRLEEDERTLHVATVAPRTLAALSSLTGKRIVPWIAPAIRIMQAMELHYGIPMKPRYIKLRDQLNAKRAPIALAGETVDAKPAPAPAPATEDGTWLSPPEEDQQADDFGYGRSWREVAEQSFAAELSGDTAGRTVESPAGPVPWEAGHAEAELQLGPLAHATSLLRIRAEVAAELRRLGLAISDRADQRELVRWVALQAVGARPCADEPQLARDGAGLRYRWCAARTDDAEGVVVDMAPQPEADVVICVDLEGAHGLRAVLRVPFRTILDLGTAHERGLRVAWSDLVEHESVGTLIDGSGRTEPAFAGADLVGRS